MKTKFYVATRNARRADKAEVRAAIDAFMSSGNGSYAGDEDALVHVMNHCLERGIPVELTHLGESAVLRRIRV